MATELEQKLIAVIQRELETGTLRRMNYPSAFMLARSDVIEAIAAGYDLKTIWEYMRETGRIPFRYETFLKYVRKYITNAPTSVTAGSATMS